MNKNFKQMVSNRQKKKRLVTRALVMTLFMALFTRYAQAQTPKIFMRDGSTTIARSNPLYEFYDSHGPSQTPECWNYWYAHNEDFTYVFKPEIAGDMIKVSFVTQTCYNNDVSIGNWALRLNNDFLYVYEGNGVNEDNLIAALTGNSEQPFTIMTNGAVTFHFVSDGRYREEGWKAEVRLVQANQGNMEAQAPFIRHSTCFDAAELLPTTLGAVMYYTTDGSNPTTSSTAEIYRDPIDFPASGNFTVKAASKLDGESTAWSEVVTHTFTDDDRIPTPGVPTITRNANSNIVVMTPAAVPTGVNETYVVRYTVTTNGTEPVEPDINNSTLYTGPITCTNPNIWYKAKTFGSSCSNWVSTETAELHITTLYAPAPVISFGDDMFITASEGGVLYDILYTLDGTDPTLSPQNGTHSATTVSLAGIAYGTTVKAMAFKMNGTDIDTQYQPSVVVTAIYVPEDEDGNTINGVYGNIVLIDDREPHTWSYYSDSETNPIYSLKPADIKITYSGNGTNNMTPNPSSIGNALNTVTDLENLSNYTENATHVHVNHDASANQFVYLKTLENDDADGTGDYTYTTIPNPFQARPIHQSAKGGENGVGIDGNQVLKAEPMFEVNEHGEMIPVHRASAMGEHPVQFVNPDVAPRGTNATNDVTYEKVTASQSDWSGTYLLSTTAGYAFTSVITSDSIGDFTTLTVTNSGSTIANPGSAAILTIAKYSGDNSYYTIQINGGNYLISGGNGLMTGASATNGTYTDNDGETAQYFCYWNISYSSSNGILINCPAWGGTYYLKFINFTDTESGYLYQYFLDTSTDNSAYYDDVDLFKQTNSGSGSSDCVTEYFNGNATAYNSSTINKPTEWEVYNSNSTYAYSPRISNAGLTSYIPGQNSDNGNNYLVFATKRQNNNNYTYWSYAIAPKYSDVTSVSFKYCQENANYGTFTVGYVTSNTGYSTYTVLQTLTPSANKTWYTYTLTQAQINTINNNNGYLAFRFGSVNSNSYYCAAIDDVEICVASQEPSITVTPTSVTLTTGHTAQLTATTYNATGATITWSSNNTAVATVVTNSKDTSTATVTGVAPGAAVITASITVDGTTYTASSSITVVAPSYCSPAPTSVDGTGFYPVVFGSGSETVNNSSYPTSNPYYGDYSSMVGAYMQGATAQVQITYNTSSYNYGTIIWVDWDQDYVFEETEIVSRGTSASGSSTDTWTFVIPSNQAVGYYRMRIGGADSAFDTYISGSSTTAPDPCYNGTYAMFHDYTLHVIAAVEPPAQPVITVASGTYTEAFSTTITCATSGAVIYYTTDGSNPSATNGTMISSGDAVSITQTCVLKAVAVKDGAESTVASASYLISTGGGSLDCEDFESYTSSANSSYNTAGSLPSGWGWYYGRYYHYNSNYVPHLYNGTLAKDGVGIVMTAGYDEYVSAGGGSSTTYIGYQYWLESDITMVEGATITFNTWVENTAYGVMTYGYWDSSDAWQSLGTATTAAYTNATASDGVTTFTVPAAAAGFKLNFRWVYNTSTSGDNYSAVIDNVCQETTGAPSAPVFSLASGEYTGAQTVTITCSTSGATIYYTTDGTTPTTSSQTITSGSTVTISSSCTLQAIAVNTYGSSAVTSATYTITSGTSNSLDYRGFYAWKVTHLSEGLTLTVNGNDYTSSNLGNGVVVYPEENVVFKTDNAEGNEVEFVALWAQAYVTTSTSGMSNYASNSGRYKNAYERNFHKVSSSIPVLSTYPYTVSTINPDGTGTVGTITRTSNLSCSNDMKLENMNLSMSSYYIDGNGKNLAIGRGVKNGTSNVATAVYGDYAPATSTSNFTLRVESGQYTQLFDFYNNSSNDAVTITTGFNNHVILGSDYDRASGTNANDNLIVAGATEVGYYTFTSSSSAKVHFKVLSGTFGTDAADQEFYMGFEYGTGNKLAHRTLEIFGGEFLGGLAGGIEEGMSASEEMLKMRIHGGTFHRYFYGAGQYSAATGTRRFVVTGGTFDCWIAGGCYGTSEGGGATDGDINLYFGGKAKQTSTGGLFGAGYGNYGTGNGYYTVNKSTVVVADDAQVAGNVYGGGNNGYATDVTKVYVLGGDALNIAGNVYGGANQAQSDAAVTVTMNEGTVGGSLYGGANTSGEVKGLATVNVSGGTVTNVFGGGLGNQTNMASGTKVNISGGTINNVYGGGALGTTNAGTEVTMTDGSVNDVFGAGMGGTVSGTTHYANINGTTKVTVKGGTVNGAVYGGGENGSVQGVAGSFTSMEDYNETFNNTTAATHNASTSYIPTGWQRYRSSNSYALVPRVSNYSNYNYIGNYDGNYLIMAAKNSTYAYAIAPKYENISSIKFRYRLEGSSYGTITVGYVTNNSSYSTFTALTGTGASLSGTTSWTEVSLTEAQINTINNNNGYLAFRYTSSYTGTDYYCAAIDNVYITTRTITPIPAAQNVCSTVTISGGEVKGDVFGGGKMGKTYGSTFVNVIGDLDKTIIRQNVFAGAYGAHDEVFVGGPKTVNIMGGRVYGSVYGGSRNADDANEITTTHTGNETETTSITNVTGGQVDEHVYAAGYYGKTYGSVYGFIGFDAVQNAPHHAASLGQATASDLGLSNVEYTKRKLVINGTVWAGGDWGVFNGSFGAPTISGNSNIYIDGLGYSTDGNDPNAVNYMNIAGSILGSGTSCDAGSLERTLIIRDYGADIANTGSDADVNPYARASRQSTSIQRFHNVLFDRAHIGFSGQGKVNSLNNTEKYSLYEIDTVVRVANGSTLVMNAPASQLQSVRSVTCGDSYTISLEDSSNDFTTVNYDGLGETGGATDNKIRVNGGSYVEVRHFADPDNPGANEKSYGELAGFFHMMSSNDSDDATCAYARPKDSEEPGNSVPSSEDFSDDGGFVSYTSRYNQYDANGALTAEGGQVQLRYENHTPNQRENSEYFRIWRYGGNHHHLEGIFNADAVDDDTDYKTVTVTIQLPAWHSKNSYYRFDRTGTTTYNTLIDYGSDVLTYNAAAYGAVNGNNWMYYDSDNEAQVTGLAVDNSTIAANLASGIDDNENLNYGLVITPGDAMTGSTYIINSDADNYLATNAQFNCATGGMTQVPTVTFTLTYSNHLTANMSWDPMVIPLVQCDESGQITDYVDIELTINTSTDITSGFTTQVYARMIGGTNIAEVSTVHLVLPTFPVAVNGEEAEFSLIKAVFTPDVELNSEGNAVSTHNVVYSPKSGVSFGYNNFGLTIGAVPNPDNTDDWRDVQGEKSGNPGDGSDLSLYMGKAGGRSSLTFGINLYYNSNYTVNDKTHMGDVTFTVQITNYQGGDGTDHIKTFDVTVEIYRIGSGKNFYVDGINGEDASGTNRGRYPDKAAKTINYIFNRLGYMPGDNIFVVNEMPINKNTTWDGASFQNEVNVYRYPGGHGLSGENPSFDNSPYLGTLADVTRELNIKGIMMDGMYAESQASPHNSTLYPSACSFDGEAEAPMIVIEDGGRVNLTSVTELKNNYNANNSLHGGAVNVNYGGVLAMNMGASITGNVNAQGGGVFVDGAMIVSDSIVVYNNYKDTGMTHQNNVYLAPMTSGRDNRDGSFRVVQIGTSAADAYAELLQPTGSDYNTKIGVSKEDWSNTYEGYMPVAYAEGGTESYLNLPYNTQNIIVHDENVYDLERYVTDLHADSRLYLYWLGTWVTAQYWNPYFESNEAAGYTPYMTAAQLSNIETAEQLAWVISLANGENGVDKTNANYVISPIKVTKDIDMSANIWVPIGNETSLFTGTFEGNGHVVKGIKSPLSRTNMGMFGATQNATISDVIVNAQFNGSANNMGTVVGTMTGGTISNVEGVGSLTNSYADGNTGGLVGVNAQVASGSTAGVIHSSFATPDISGGKNIGGLLAVNYGNLLNAYSNVTIDGGTNVGGLVAINHGLVENCYNITEVTYPFAAVNDGTITKCYAADGITTYVGDNTATLNGHGNYKATANTHTYGYMYSDNAVELVSGQSENNSYVVDAITYANNQIDKWPGLLSTLNQWVFTNNGGDYTYTKWLRPTTKYINDDLPVLCFPKDNCLVTSTGRALKYSAFDGSSHSTFMSREVRDGSDGFGNQGFGQTPQTTGDDPSSSTSDAGNGIDNLLEEYEDKTGYIFVYDNAIDVEKVPDEHVYVFINEDVVLKQVERAGKFINTQVGVSFDNSCGNATDFFGNTLAYDWHMLSTPLANAPLGISYNSSAQNWWDESDNTQMSGVEHSYMPDGGENDNTWDLYCFYEPEYHWINLKRNSGSHHHYDANPATGNHDLIAYTNEDTLVAGKGYMAAIKTDTYLCNDGTLNGPSNPVSIKLTKKSHDPGTEELGYNLLGNPYQAYLDVNLFLGNNGLSSYWVYVAENDNYIAGNADASTNPALPSATLHPHQGFFVLANSDNQEVNFDYSTMALTTPVANSYYRGEKLDYPLVNLFATSEKGKKDLAVIEFNRPEFGGSKKMRAINNADFELAAHMNNTRYSILFTEEGTEKVPVHFRTNEAGTFTMTWSTYHGNFTSLFLVDNLTGTRTDMLRTDHYTFNGTPDDYDARFYITFKCTGVEEYSETEEDFAWYNGNDWIVNGKGQLQVFDVLGHVLQSQRVIGEQTRLNLEGYAAGVYMLHLTDGKTSKVQKIVVR